jgi:pimeloyl-ACP methyl ester carboxylesterase
LKLRQVSCLSPSGFHRLAYREWDGPKGGRTIILVHGLTRNSRDFLVLGEALSATHRVIAPDMPGRGESGWLANPSEYSYPTYLADIATLIARLDVEEVDWVGTSMGGLIAMFLAATPGNPIRRLVINDASALVPKAFVEHLLTYVGLDMDRPDEAALIASARYGYAPQPDLSDAQWRQIALAGAREKEGGGYRLDYDPRISESWRATPPADVALWPFWDKIECPILLLRGGVSPLLKAEDAAEMIRRRPNARLVEFPGCAHPPSLVNEAQIGPVRAFLNG